MIRQSLNRNPAFSWTKRMSLLDFDWKSVSFSLYDGEWLSEEEAFDFVVSPGFLAPRVSGKKREMGIAKAWRTSPSVKGSHGSFFINAAAMGGPTVKQSILAAPSRKKVEALRSGQYRSTL